MPAQLGPRVGLECVLAYNTTIASTITAASFSAIPEAVDVNCPFAHTKIPAPSRASTFLSQIAGLTTLELTFGYNYQGDPGDTVFTAMRAAFLARTPWHWAVMDNLLVSPGPAGAQGIVFPGLIFDFPIDQPLEGPTKIEIGVSLTRFKVSGTLVNPSWLIIAPTA
jgi:hypothetical protein